MLFHQKPVYDVGVDFKGFPDQRFGHLSYAQHGDDFMLLNIFDLIGVEKPSYLDVGAHHPTKISNTALLYARGSSGVNVEANPYLMEEFYKHRCRDVNLNFGVAAKYGTMQFYMSHRDGGRNTFDPTERDQWVSEGHPVSEVMNIHVVTINSIVNGHCGGLWKDFLSLDVEGLDYEILESADFNKNKPKVICVETRRKDGQRMKELMRTRGYFCYCRLIENLIFVDTKYQDLLY